MDELTEEFLVESYENLNRMDRDIVKLEQSPSKEILGNIFRAIHTIKGTCGFLGFLKLESVTHAGENLLSLLRDGALPVSQPITDGLLAMVDAVREMLASIESIGNEGERDDTALINTLHALQEGDLARASSGHKPSEGPATAPPQAAEAPVDLTQLGLEELERLIEQRGKETKPLGHRAKARRAAGTKGPRDSRAGGAGVGRTGQRRSPPNRRDFGPAGGGQTGRGAGNDSVAERSQTRRRRQHDPRRRRPARQA